MSLRLIRYVITLFHNWSNNLLKGYLFASHLPRELLSVGLPALSIPIGLSKRIVQETSFPNNIVQEACLPRPPNPKTLAGWIYYRQPELKQRSSSTEAPDIVELPGGVSLYSPHTEAEGIKHWSLDPGTYCPIISLYRHNLQRNGARWSLAEDLS